MKIDTKEALAKESIFHESNPVIQKNKALQALKVAKEIEAKKLASGKKWTRLDGRTEALR